MITNQSNVHKDDAAYDAFINRINERYNALTGPIFETDASGLYQAYLAAFPEGEARQYHTCSCCKQFIEKFGALAVVGDDGQVIPAVWDMDDVPPHYEAAVAAMARLVRRAKITMPFLSSDGLYGTPESHVKASGHVWHHFAIRPAVARVFKAGPLKTAFQAASEKREEFGSVLTAMGEYSRDTCAMAFKLLKDDQLGNSQAVMGQAQFLVDLHDIRATVGGSNLRSNLVFRAVATAPSGFCHPRASMIATLLDDIQAGKTFEQAKAAWEKKMHPLAYQRPQAAPSAGAIKAAEEAFEKMGAASALRRRFATLADVLDKLWEPKQIATAPAGGIFGSVKAKGAQPAPMSMRAPAIIMTWEKFARTVLPTADAIEIFAEYGNAAYCALTTASDPDAVPLLQWDSAERRNPVALYLWNGGSTAESFSLRSRAYHKVTAITLRPNQWFGSDKFDHQHQGAILIIEGAKDTRKDAGCALFPSTIRSEFHGVRAVIEAYSKANELEGRDEASACGLLIGKGDKSGAQLRVTSAGQSTEYRIDRWD